MNRSSECRRNVEELSFDRYCDAKRLAIEILPWLSKRSSSSFLGVYVSLKEETKHRHHPERHI